MRATAVPPNQLPWVDAFSGPRAEARLGASCSGARAPDPHRAQVYYYHTANPYDRRTLPAWEALIRENLEVGLPWAVCEGLRWGLRPFANVPSM